MIKVIERGTKTIGECENCGCRFSYEKKDIKKDKLYARGELKAVISYVNCPHCGIAHKLMPKIRRIKMGDNVNHPNHYQNIAGVEAIDILNDVVKDLPGKQAAILWNTLKYLLRFQKKNGVEDLKKAQNYLQYLIDDIEAVQEVDKNIQENTNPEKCLCAIYKSKISGYAEVCYSTEMLYGTCEKIRFTNELARDMFIAEFFNEFNSEDYKEETYSIRDVLINSNYIVPNTTDNFCIKFPWRDIFERFKMSKEDDKYVLEFVYKN